MKIITVNASRSYDVKIGAGLLATIGTEAAALVKNGTAAVVSDSNVWPLYGNTVCSSLESVGLRVVYFVFPAGESSKNAHTYLSILNFLAENHLTRSDIVIALGGGVVGDMAGFVAATYLRGIPYIQVPTTLLAAVDSSVGGKTAIDLEVGKNLVGAFYQPRLVLCDTDTLQSLPTEIFRDGSAEVIKYGILYDPELTEHLFTHGLTFDRESVIAKCVEWKRNVVLEDEFDTGARQKLNLGHTIGHSIEALSNFSISHGTAVAIGMAIVTRAAVARGICDFDVLTRLLQILEKFALPHCTEYAAEALYRCAHSDKKRTGGTLNLVVPQKIGDCILLPTKVEELKTFIEAGL